jgi:hypothetical protein
MISMLQKKEKSPYDNQTFPKSSLFPSPSILILAVSSEQEKKDVHNRDKAALWSQ